jgi:tetratricopeptide (TPR) repeat protein
MLKEESGDRAAARSAYERALALNPNDGVAANNLAWLYAGAGQTKSALRLAERARAALGDAPEALDTLGWMYHLTGASSQAIPLLKAAYDKRPGHAVYQEHLKAASAR